MDAHLPMGWKSIQVNLKLYLKFRCCEKATKFEKRNMSLFDKLLYNVKRKWEILFKFL